MKRVHSHVQRTSDSEPVAKITQPKIEQIIQGKEKNKLKLPKLNQIQINDKDIKKKKKA